MNYGRFKSLSIEDINYTPYNLHKEAGSETIPVYLHVRYLTPQLWVVQHHLWVLIGNNNLLMSGPTGVQSGRVLQTGNMPHLQHWCSSVI